MPIKTDYMLNGPGYLVYSIFKSGETKEDSRYVKWMDSKTAILAGAYTAVELFWLNVKAVAHEERMHMEWEGAFFDLEGGLAALRQQSGLNSTAYNLYAGYDWLTRLGRKMDDVLWNMPEISVIITDCIHRYSPRIIRESSMQGNNGIIAVQCNDVTRAWEAHDHMVRKLTYPL
ncbi:MAG: hypothetical protein HZB67_03110 [Candidatus Aenigmarchaeota archaeon]|nr:hypothetical protein [Candidatus Aenigmarchaeota archaeon]